MGEALSVTEASTRGEFEIGAGDACVQSGDRQGVVSKAEVEASFKDLVSRGKVQWHPSYMGSRTALYSVRPIDPKDYLSHAIQKLAEKLKVSRSELTALAAKLTLEGPDISDQNPTSPAQIDVSQPVADTTSILILQAMHEINSNVATGDVVSIRELHKRLDFHFATKLAFDRAILNIARDQIAIHRDDFASTKSPAEQEVLVRDDRGKFYNVVSLRRPS